MKTRPAAVLMAFVAAACTAGAADPKPSQDRLAAKTTDPPDFIAGWRVSGVIKQGGKLQASLENSGRAARFVREGDELTPGVVVEKIEPGVRSVHVRRDKQTAVIRPGPAPAPAKTTGAPGQSHQQDPQQPPQPARPPWGGGPPWMNGAGNATQDEQGRWGIRFGNGGFFSAQDYANRFGGADQAVAHINQRMSEPIDPQRRAFYQQMLTALQNSGSSGGVPQAAPAAVVQPVVSAPPPVVTPPPQVAPMQPQSQQQPLYAPLPPPRGRTYF